MVAIDDGCFIEIIDFFFGHLIFSCELIDVAGCSFSLVVRAIEF